jgi:hypothetical protein
MANVTASFKPRPVLDGFIVPAAVSVCIQKHLIIGFTEM